MKNINLAVIGLGYVGLQLALALAKHFEVIGYDINSERIKSLKQHIDKNLEFSSDILASSSLKLSDQLDDLNQASIFIISVPTPIDKNQEPDLNPLTKVTKTLAPLLKKGDTIIYESSVYPGTTENICIPLLEQGSKLHENHDFFVAYSPERINPGDKEHDLTHITKLIAARNQKTLALLQDIYQPICREVYICPSIAIAEASKILENCQRDVNIALMNEFTCFMHQLGLPSHEVIRAARSKYNFAPFHPGLVGGHCIPIDPQYLIFQARQHGIDLKLLSAARKINDGIIDFILHQLDQHMQNLNKVLKLGVFGLSYKPNVPDVRNSLVFNFLDASKNYSLDLKIHDPILAQQDVPQYALSDFASIQELDILMIFVAHDVYREQGLASFIAKMQPQGILMDIGHCFAQTPKPKHLNYWLL